MLACIHPKIKITPVSFPNLLVWYRFLAKTPSMLELELECYWGEGHESAAVAEAEADWVVEVEQLPCLQHCPKEELRCHQRT